MGKRHCGPKLPESKNSVRGARAVFINMPLREGAIPNTPPIGVGLLAAILREHGAQVSIIDLNAYRINDGLAISRGLNNGRHLTLDETKSLISRHFAEHGEPCLVALSGLITTLQWQTDTVRIVREIHPDAFIISGGGLATEFGDGLFKWIPELDGVAIGEGDEIIAKILDDALKTKKSLDRRRSCYIGCPPKDLDLIPFPAWDLLDEDVDGSKIFEQYLKVPAWGGSAKTKNSSAAPFTMERSAKTVSSRGCPYNCNFCYRGMQGGRIYRDRSARNLLEEALWYIDDYHVDFIGYADDNFMINRKRISEMAKLFKPLRIRWGTHGRMDEAADLKTKGRKKIEDMAEAGCIYIGFGAESAHHTILESMGKGGFILSEGLVDIGGYMVPKTMVEGVKAVHGAGIHGNCTWIMGWPGETLEQLKTSVAFIKWQEEFLTKGLAPGTSEFEVAKNSVNKSLFVATAYPGTQMFKMPKVRQLLSESFGIRFDPETNDPLIDDNLKKYVLELDDATKLLAGSDGNPLNFSDMSDDVFLQARELIKKGDTYKILDL